MHALISPLIDDLIKAIPMVVRSAPPTGDYLEGVLSRQNLKQCYDMLNVVFGQPTKDFGNATNLERNLQKLVDCVGGIRLDQCLFVKRDAEGNTTYAALWPWASDATRITLKVGILKLYEVKEAV